MFKEIMINKKVLDEFKSYADRSPSEICGFVTGKCYADTPANVAFGDTLELIDNISHRAKAVDYVMDPQQMMNVMRTTTFMDKKAKIDLVASIHSHPTGAAIPSTIDLNRAEYDWVYLIYSPVQKEVNAFTYDHQNKEFYKIPIHEQN